MQKFLLSIILLLSLARTVSALPRVFILTKESRQTETRQLLNVISNEHMTIGETDYRMMYGKDGSSLVFVDLLNAPTNGFRLFVVQRQTAEVLVNTNIIAARPVPRMLPFEELVSVQSEHAAVCFPAVGKGNTFAGFVSATWNREQAKSFTPLPKGLSTFAHFTTFPSGFAIMTYSKTIAIFDTRMQKQPLFLQDEAEGARENRRLYYAPDLGLMEYNQGEHYRLTDAGLSKVFVNSLRIPSENINSKMFVRVLKRRSCLIWCDARSTTSSEIVVFDLGKEVETIRQPIDFNAGSSFMPNTAGTKVYFLNQENGKISFLDLETKQVNAFCDLGIPDAKGYTILDAD